MSRITSARLSLAGPAALKKIVAKVANERAP